MIIFNKIRWRNLLSTGNVFTEINLTENKTNLIIGANGAGKSTVLDALTFSLFGKPFRKINKPMLVNSINEKDCVTEVEFNIGKNNFLIRRGIKPGIFEIYQNDQLLDQNSSTSEYQLFLEQNILKMNYKSFTQIVVLGSSTFVPFMRLPLAQRREIIEDILDIQIFSVMNSNLKEKLKIANDDIKDRDYQLDMYAEKITMQESFIKDIESRTENDIKEKKVKLNELWEQETESDKICHGLLEKQKELNSEIEKYSSATEKIKKLTNLKGKIQQKFSNHKNQHQFFVKNTTCPTCTQDITESLRDAKVDEIMSSIKELRKGMEQLDETIEQEETREKEFVRISNDIKTISNEISIQQFQISRYQKESSALQKEIEELQNNNSNSSQEKEKLQEMNAELERLKKDMAVVKEERDCLFVASKLLKDNGIKTRIIKKYLPVMNTLINDYLQNMDFYVNFTLNENFEETIKSRHRDIFSYESFSEGEKARIDIALLLTWRSVAKLKNSVDTNLLILDEIFDGSLDSNGSTELGWILKNFDNNTNVFVISHKEGMSDRFDKTIRFEKIKNFSVPRVALSEVD